MGQAAENVRPDLGIPNRGHGCLRESMLEERRNLLANQDAEESHQRDHGRRRRSDVQQAVKHTDRKADCKRHDVGFHRRLLWRGRDRTKAGGITRASCGQNAKQAHPSAPQKLARSAAGMRLDQARAWAWPWTPQRFAQPQAAARSLARAGFACPASAQAA